jgi:hypothetical protein
MLVLATCNPGGWSYSLSVKSSFSNSRPGPLLADDAVASSMY